MRAVGLIFCLGVLGCVAPVARQQEPPFVQLVQFPTDNFDLLEVVSAMLKSAHVRYAATGSTGTSWVAVHPEDLDVARIKMSILRRFGVPIALANE